MRRLALALALVLVLAPAFAPFAASAGPLVVSATAPGHVAVGRAVSIAGLVRLANSALVAPPAIEVHIEEDGVEIGSAVTGPDGRYAFAVRHTTRGAHTYVAVVTRDAGAALESRSPPVTVAWAVAPSAAPAPTVVQGAHGQQALLSWAAPADDGGAPMLRAHVYRAASAAGPWALVGNTTTRSFAIDGLAWSTAYAFQVREENVAGVAPVGAATEHPTPAPVAPGAPSALTAVFADEPAVIELTWAPPAAPGNGVITGYQVEASADGGPFHDAAEWRVWDDRAFFFTGYGIDWTVRVRALSTAGEGEWATATASSPDVDGLRGRIDDITVIQYWGPTGRNERWIRAAEDGTTDVFGRLEILLLMRGDLHEDNVPQTRSPLTLDQTLTWAGGSASGTLATQTDQWGDFYTAVFLDVGTLAEGECVAFDGSSVVTAGADSVSDTAAFTLCGVAEPST